MPDMLERVVKIETTVEYIKDSLDRLVDNTDSHILQSQKNAIEIVELKARVQKIEERENGIMTPQTPTVASSTKIASISAGAAGIVIGIIEYLKR